MSSPEILVLRATGAQGTGVLRYLQKQNIRARAFVTDSNAPRAQALLKYGAELREGSLSDIKALETALSGCTGVFLNQMPSFTDDSETREAKLVLNLARKHGIKHVVHATSLGVPRQDTFRRNQGITAAAIIGKADVEELVQASGVEYWTILRGGYFDTNFLGFPSQFMFPGLASERKITTSYKPGLVLPLVDPSDIGAFAVAAFSDPTRFHQQIIPVVGEIRSFEQAVDDLSKAIGNDIEIHFRTDAETEELAKSDPIVESSKWMHDLWKEADVEGIRKWGVQTGSSASNLHTFPEFLEQEHQLVRETFQS
jgi:uncharacterized protein YbjT (DUF2867 family)